MNIAGAAKIRKLDGAAFTRAFLGVAVVGLLVAYGTGISNDFTADDVFAVRDNAAIRTLRNVPSFLFNPFTLSSRADGVDLRPVVVTSYALNYALSGHRPWSYRAVNLLVHLLSGFLVFLLVRDHLWWPERKRGADGDARWPAAAAALFFLLAPMNHQAVAYLWARPALFGTLFYLAAFHSLLSRRLGTAVFFQTLALLSAASAVTLPAMFIGYDYLYRDRTRHPGVRAWARDWSDLLVPVTPMVVADIVFLAQRANSMPGWVNLLSHERWVTPWIWFMSQWSVLLHYAQTFLVPTGFAVDHARPFTMALAEAGAGISLVVVVAWIVSALWASRRFPHVAFATLWIFVTLAPESTFLPQAELLVDHRPYVAVSLGFAVLLAWAVDRGSRYAGALRTEAFVTAVLAWSLVMAVVGFARTFDWTDEVTVWERAVKVEPTNGRAWVGLALAHLEQKDARNARRLIDRARPMLPTSPDLHTALCRIDLAEGHPDEAIAAATQAVRFGRLLARTHACLAAALEQKGSRTEALAEYRRAAALAPNDSARKADVSRLGRLLEAKERSGDADALAGDAGASPEAPPPPEPVPMPEPAPAADAPH